MRGQEKSTPPQANFVFKGTVRKLNAATVTDLPVKGKTAVVRVDEVLNAPPLLSDYAGSDITVILGGRESVKKGEQAVFRSNSCLVGESLVVKSVGHAPAGAGAGVEAQDPDLLRLRQKVENADAVVTGRVTSVREVDEAEGRPRRRSSPPETKISEHSPVWREAVIEVADVEKGGSKGKQLRVRFPGSSDVRWYGTPKLEPGQEGVFLLSKGVPQDQREVVSATKKKALANTYTVMDSDAFQPMQKVGAIRTLIKAKSSKR